MPDCNPKKQTGEYGMGEFAQFCAEERVNKSPEWDDVAWKAPKLPWSQHERLWPLDCLPIRESAAGELDLGARPDAQTPEAWPMEARTGKGATETVCRHQASSPPESAEGPLHA